MNMFSFMTTVIRQSLKSQLAADLMGRL